MKHLWQSKNEFQFFPTFPALFPFRHHSTIEIQREKDVTMEGDEEISDYDKIRQRNIDEIKKRLAAEMGEIDLLKFQVPIAIWTHLLLTYIPATNANFRGWNNDSGREP